MVSDVLDGTYEKVNDSNQRLVPRPESGHELKHLQSEIHLVQPSPPVVK